MPLDVNQNYICNLELKWHKHNSQAFTTGLLLGGIHIRCVTSAHHLRLLIELLISLRYGPSPHFGFG